MHGGGLSLGDRTRTASAAFQKDGHFTAEILDVPGKPWPTGQHEKPSLPEPAVNNPIFPEAVLANPRPTCCKKARPAFGKMLRHDRPRPKDQNLGHGFRPVFFANPHFALRPLEVGPIWLLPPEGAPDRGPPGCPASAHCALREIPTFYIATPA